MWWAEYFNELLNPSTPPDRSEHEDDLVYQTADRFIAEPTLQEVSNEILKLRNFKTPGIDNLLEELFKCERNALGITLHELIVRVWRNEELPEE